MSETSKGQAGRGFGAAHGSPILAWLANGRVGLSSKTMAMTALGVPVAEVNHPHDPDDLNRCLLLLKAAPVVREAFPKIAALSPVWAALIKRWDDIEASFFAECGLDWCKSTNGRATYALMRRVIESANDQAQRPGSRDADNNQKSYGKA